jgi:hypothetical protein
MCYFWLFQKKRFKLFVIYKKSVLLPRRDGRVVDCGSLENY